MLFHPIIIPKQTAVVNSRAVFFAIIPAAGLTAGAPRCTLLETFREGFMTNGQHLLFYRNPARCWEEALPLGNGRIGAMVYGRADEELIELNEDTLRCRNAAYARR